MKKKKYMKPSAVDIYGKLAHGAACKSGSNATGNCTAGGVVSGAGQCTSGETAQNNCNAGGNVT